MVKIEERSFVKSGPPDSREWLETNGLGGYASSTLSGANTRRYHGLLVAALQPPVGRVVLLNKLEESLMVEGERYELSANFYPGTVYPDGHRYLTAFRLDPFPVFTYSVAGVEIEKSIFMLYGRNITVVQWRIMGKSVRPMGLEVRPMASFRDFHALTRVNTMANTTLLQKPGWASLRMNDLLPALHFAHDAAALEEKQFWFYNLEYPVEQERGLEHQEDLFSPCTFQYELNNTQPVATLIASDTPVSVSDAEALRTAEIKRRKSLVNKIPLGDTFQRELTLAADQFIVQRGTSKSVIAGYHWFCDWGRDTMIALHGLTLTTGRSDDARAILETFAAHLDQGMLPNRFSDHGGAPEYNTVDATLWFFNAVHSYCDVTSDKQFIKSIYSKLVEVMDWHVRGTRHGIRVQDDGLLCAGEPGVQLTWMDAKVGDWVVTPRNGKPVEVQALWFNALKIMESFATTLKKKTDQERFRGMADKAEQSFTKAFWNESKQCLYDLVNDDHRDDSVRPNQVFALSLPWPLVTGDQAAKVLEKVERELLTPFGLRTLSPSDAHYKGVFTGNMMERDSAYHQGTVWPWLIGAYLEAHFRVRGATPETIAHAQRVLIPLERSLQATTPGQLPEVFNGDAPHTPGGCMAQAWSVAEVLRSVVQIRAMRAKNSQSANLRTAMNTSSTPTISREKKIWLR